MSNADMPANPLDPKFGMHEMPYIGLTKREIFAMNAMQGILANEKYEPPRRDRLSGMAIDAVSAAETLLAALER